ncbi:Lanthionine synthetase C-like protein [Promicromonospora umidemergens]|nr:lanthionine synthetase LanC family protein [Promicromonospora umidemergens]MCP2282782.1 Lanthionine synthetase C-like protein [Promicromonospora umidemergens]
MTRPAPAPSAPAAVGARGDLPGSDVGSAILAVELALTGDGRWDQAEMAIDELTRDPDVSGAASLFHGAPAAALAMDTAAVDGYLDLRDAQLVAEARRRQAQEPRLFREMQLDLDEDLRQIVEQRLAAAEARYEAGRPPTAAEFGLLEGMLGLGVILLRRAPGTVLMQRVIDYVVSLTRPVLVNAVRLPGWYVAHNPGPDSSTPGGHVNMTMASGAGGLLAFLVACVRAGYTRDSLHVPIKALVDWFVRWQQPASAEWPDSVWWPRWVTPAEVQVGHLVGSRGVGEALPSWSRMAGMARAVQMGASVLAASRYPHADEARMVRALAEEAMLACLTNRQLRRLSSGGLWGGLAGLYQTGYRAAADATGPTEIRLKHRMSAVGDALRSQVVTLPAGGPGDLWSGESGLRLAAQTLRRGTAPTSWWDACLLVTGNPYPADRRSAPWS